MVQIRSSLLLAAITATTLVSAKGMERQRRQESSSKHHHRSSTATAAAAAPTSSFTGSLPASVLSIVSTITSGEGDTAATTALYSTAVAGAVNPSVSGAPALPAATGVNPADFPTLDQVPPLDSPQAKAWIAEIDMSKVPNIPKTIDSASCGSNPDNYANREANGWWTCGGYTRETDITTCPNKNTWGLSYDDGPSPYTPTLLDYLDEHNLKSTFFVVGSRAISRPDMLQLEYMGGHQLSVHTWSHPALTTLSNEEIVVELAWTREVIRAITGVSPNTMRPPYGDIDDRVRAICTQMDLTPIIWTSTPDGQTYDTEDWQIAGGVVTSEEVVYNFEQIINNASQLDTGYIVLAHDLYQQSVEIAVEVVLPAALQQSPKQTLMPIITCLNRPMSDAYVETYNNKSGMQPYTTGKAENDAAAGGSSGGSSGSGGSSDAFSILAPAHVSILGAVALGVAALL